MARRKRKASVGTNQLVATLHFRVKGSKKIEVVHGVTPSEELMARLAHECDYFFFDGTVKRQDKKKRVFTTDYPLPQKWLHSNNRRTK